MIESLLSPHKHPFLAQRSGDLGRQRQRQKERKFKVIFGFIEFQASLGYILRKRERGEEEGEKQEEEG